MDTVTLHVHRFSCGRDAQASSCDPRVWTVYVAWTGRQIKKTPTGAANVSLRRVRSRRVASCAPESPPSPAASPDYESPRTSPCVQDPDQWHSSPDRQHKKHLRTTHCSVSARLGRNAGRLLPLAQLALLRLGACLHAWWPLMAHLDALRGCSIGCRGASTARLARCRTAAPRPALQSFLLLPPLRRYTSHALRS